MARINLKTTLTLMLVVFAAVLMFCDDATAYTEKKIMSNDPEDLARFGNSVSISGDYAIVGAPKDDDNDSGSAYIYKRSGSTWTQQTKLTASDQGYEYFGTSVSISGDYVIVGGGSNRYGIERTVYIFVRSGNTWTQQAKFSRADNSGDFGRSVSISGDYAIVGDPLVDGNGWNRGAAYLFIRNGSSWTQQVEITDSDSNDNGRFGWAVSISGDYAIVGKYYADEGAAYVFVRNGSTWTQQTKLTGSDGTGVDYFGSSVSISGNYAIVGAHLARNLGSSPGGAYIFMRSGTTWIQQAKLTVGGATYDFFGSSVAISSNYAIVGRPSSFKSDKGDSAIYVFKRNGSSWPQLHEISASDRGNYDYFGCSVGLSGDYAIVGARKADYNGDSTGSAYVFDNLNYGAINFVGTSNNGNARIYSTSLPFDDTRVRDEYVASFATESFGAVVGSLLGITSYASAVTIAYVVYKIIYTYIDSIVDPVLIVPLAKDLDTNWLDWIDAGLFSYVGEVSEVDGISGMILLDFKGKHMTTSYLENVASNAGLRIQAREGSSLLKEIILIKGSEFLDFDPELNYIIIPETENIFYRDAYNWAADASVEARLQFRVLSGSIKEHKHHFRFSYKDVPDSEDCGSEIVPEIAIGSGVSAFIERFDDDIFTFELNSPTEIDITTTTSEIDTMGQLLNSSCQVIAEDDNSGPSYNFRIKQLLEPGHYYIVVSSKSSGGYTLWTLGEGCPDCSQDVVILQNKTVPSGSTCECVGALSITIGNDVTIESGASITFKSPVIKVQSGFKAETGASVNMIPQ